MRSHPRGSPHASPLRFAYALTLVPRVYRVLRSLLTYPRVCSLNTTFAFDAVARYCTRLLAATHLVLRCRRSTPAVLRAVALRTAARIAARFFHAAYGAVRHFFLATYTFDAFDARCAGRSYAHLLAAPLRHIAYLLPATPHLPHLRDLFPRALVTLHDRSCLCGSYRWRIPVHWFCDAVTDILSLVVLVLLHFGLGRLVLIVRSAFMPPRFQHSAHERARSDCATGHLPRICVYYCISPYKFCWHFWTVYAAHALWTVYRGPLARSRRYLAHLDTNDTFTINGYARMTPR